MHKLEEWAGWSTGQQTDRGFAGRRKKWRSRLAVVEMGRVLSRIAFMRHSSLIDFLQPRDVVAQFGYSPICGEELGNGQVTDRQHV